MAYPGNGRETALHDMPAGRARHVFNRERHRFFGGE